MRLCALLVTLCEGGRVTDQQAFLWRRRLTEERDLKNITDLHTRILLFVHGAILDGEDQMSHTAVAEALKVGVRTVGDAYRRAKALGLLAWEAQFRAVQGVRRRTVNRYWLVMPGGEAEVRPDVRRHRKPVFLSSKPKSMVECAEPVAMPLHMIARAMEERLASRWRAKVILSGGG